MEIKLSLTKQQDAPIIPAEQYGHFAEHLGRCIYGGLWSEETQALREDIVTALQMLHIPVLRWPGGCFADIYHWRDGIGKPGMRPRTINTIWGWTDESNRFGTHEFFALCDRLGCKAYLAGNMGSGTVQELADWVHYCTSDRDTTLTRERRANGQEHPWKLPYVGIGNEAWGGGGNMTPSFYADCYRQWQGFVKSYDCNTPMWKIACGPNSNDYNWTKVLMERIDPWMMQGIALHYYTVPTGNWEHKGSALDFSAEEYRNTIRGALFMEELIQKHTAIMDDYDPQKQVALVIDEWGTWYDPEEGDNPAFLYQQNTMRDAILAAITLHIFHRHTDRVRMANLAQAVNVLQALILTDGTRMICTPTYHVFEMFQKHQNAQLLEIAGDITWEDGLPCLSAIASQREGETLITLCNPCMQPCTVSLTLPEAQHVVAARILHDDDITAHNTFDAPQTVCPHSCIADIAQYGNTLTLTLPAISIMAIVTK